MPVLTIEDLASLSGDVMNFLTVFSKFAAPNPMTTENATSFTVKGSDSLTYEVSGTGMTAANGALTGGTVQSITVYKSVVVTDDQGTPEDQSDDVDTVELEPVYALTGLSLSGNQSTFATTMAGLSWTFNGTTGIDNITSTLVPALATGSNTWKLDLGADIFVGNSGIDKVYGGAGDDRLEGRGGNDLLEGNGDADTLLGGDGNDTLRAGGSTDLTTNLVNGENGRDTVEGAGGDDVLQGGSGSDIIRGNAGNDFLTGGVATVTVTAAIADDPATADTNEAKPVVYGVTAGTHTENVDLTNPDLLGRDSINGGSGNDFIYGLGGDDTLSGGSGMDSIYGGDGNDKLLGDTGNDRLSGDRGLDTLTGGEGDDKLYGGDARDVLAGSSGNDSLYGGSGNDTLTDVAGTNLLDGGTGTDILRGGSGADTLRGGANRDSLYGGAGADELTGGTGADQFIWSVKSDLSKVGDTITDYDPTAGDVIRLGLLNVDLDRAGFDGAADGSSRTELYWNKGAQQLEFNTDSNTSTIEGVIKIQSSLPDFNFSDLNLIL